MPTDEQKLLIRQMRADGLPYERIANMVGVSSSSARKVSWDVIQPARGKAECSETEACRKIFRRIKRAAIHCAEAERKGEMKPCEHCRWRKNKEPVPVCVACYREVLNRKRYEAKTSWGGEPDAQD